MNSQNEKGESTMKKIETVEDIAEFRGKIVYVQFGKTFSLSGIKRIWDREPMYFRNGTFGYYATNAVDYRFGDGVDSCQGITDKDIKRGDVFIGLATKIENATPSYDEIWATEA